MHEGFPPASLTFYVVPVPDNGCRLYEIDYGYQFTFNTPASGTVITTGASPGQPRYLPELVNGEYGDFTLAVEAAIAGSRSQVVFTIGPRTLKYLVPIDQWKAFDRTYLMPLSSWKDAL